MAAGGIRDECKVFFSGLELRTSIKRATDKSNVTSWVRTKVNFALHRIRYYAYVAHKQI